MSQHPMLLSSVVTPATQETTEYHGRCKGQEVKDGQSLRIETSPDGVELLVAAPAAGKRWEVTMSLNIKEFDA